MLNTAAFESLERYARLNASNLAIMRDHGLHPYNWLRPYILEAISREINFMRSLTPKWIDDLGFPDPRFVEINPQPQEKEVKGEVK